MNGFRKIALLLFALGTACALGEARPVAPPGGPFPDPNAYLVCRLALAPGEE